MPSSDTWYQASDLTPFDVDRLSRALVARDSSEKAFREMLLEHDKNGASGAALARACGVSRQAMHQLLNNYRRPSPRLPKREVRRDPEDDTLKYVVLDRYITDYANAVAYAALRANQTGLDVFIREIGEEDAVSVATLEEGEVIIIDRGKDER